MILNNYRKAYNMKIDQDMMADARMLGNRLSVYLNKNQGVMLGDHIVVSRKVHITMPEKRVKGLVKILVNKDAGITYLNFSESDQVIHFDLYHLEGKINTTELILEIFSVIEQYYSLDNERYQYLEEERFKAVLEICRRLYLECGSEQGWLYDLLQKRNSAALTEKLSDIEHIHILAKINPSEYPLLYLLALGIENSLLHMNIKLAKINNIMHEKYKPRNNDLGQFISFPWQGNEIHRGFSNRENVNQLILKLAEKFGGIEELESFFNTFSSGIFRQPDKNKKWGNNYALIQQLEKLDILKRGLLGVKITKEGKQLKKYLIDRRCELDMEIRRRMRKTPAVSRHNIKGAKKPSRKTRTNFLVDYARTIHQPENQWSGNLAVPETIKQAAKNSLLRGDKVLKISKRDLHQYARKTYTPVNICLLLDCSASMNEHKNQATVYLAKHLLLSTKDKVAIVSFQDNLGKVAVPFTRQEKILQKGLLNIIPSGATPMAHGIFTACTLIKNSRVKNPLLVMITDGLPNVAFWTHNPEADALKAAELIKKLKGKFICIGVESNQEFLQKLCEIADGTFYLTEDFDRKELIKIVRYAKKETEASHKGR